MKCKFGIDTSVGVAKLTEVYFPTPKAATRASKPEQ